MSEHLLITGASSGIGEALARTALARGARVTLVARRRELLEQIAASAPDRTTLLTADLADPSVAADLLLRAETAQGPLDVLVNNAGTQIVAAAETHELEAAERMLRLNLVTPLRLTRLALPSMIARGRGCIVDVASMAGLAPTPGMFYYNASKAGLAAASEGLRAEVRRHGVHVVTVYPGPVRTAMERAGRAAYEPSATMRYIPTGEADVLAALILDAVRERRPRVIYPAVYALSRHFPNLTRRLMDAMTPRTRQLST